MKKLLVCLLSATITARPLTVSRNRFPLSHMARMVTVTSHNVTSISACLSAVRRFKKRPPKYVEITETSPTVSKSHGGMSSPPVPSNSISELFKRLNAAVIIPPKSVDASKYVAVLRTSVPSESFFRAKAIRHIRIQQRMSGIISRCIGGIKRIAAEYVPPSTAPAIARG